MKGEGPRVLTPQLAPREMSNPWGLKLWTRDKTQMLLLASLLLTTSVLLGNPCPLLASISLLY